MDTELNIRVGPFELLEKLGVGGMAKVYRARHTELDQLVAVKVMTHDRAIHARFRADFRREVQAAARLNHPGIVQVFDYGVIDQAGYDGFVVGSPYLVMEIADRGSLERTRVERWSTIQRIILQVLDALAYAHARGLVHRDVKPANLLLASVPDGRVRVKLADFGIAHIDSPDGSARDDGRAVGTFAYTPPEQLHAEWRRYGPPTDLYAVGCLVWQLVTGKPPFHGESSTQVALRQLAAELPDFEPDIEIPDGLEAWLRRLLEKQPTDRYQRAADAAIALAELDTLSGSATDELANSDTLLPPDATTATVEFGETSYPDTIVVPLGDGELSRVGSDEFASGDAVALAAPRGDLPTFRRPERRPPLPADWRRIDVGHVASMAGLGLGLFGLREIPLVGREAERDAIWYGLRLVEMDERCRAVVLRGTSGAGKSRMAQWVCQRAHEVGSVTVIRASHAAGRQQGLHDLVERSLLTTGLEAAALVRHIEARLRELGVQEPEFVRGEASAIAAIVRPDEFPRATQSERVATVTRLLKRWAQFRTVVLWLDDTQWDLESIALAQHLVEHKELPLLVLLTVQDEAASRLPQVERALQRLLESSHSDQLRVEPLELPMQTELVRRLIGLEPELCEEVSRSTRGNPLFAIHLVGDWVERGVLEATRRGFVLQDEAEKPGDLHELWVRRLESVCGRFGGQEQQATLEAAVALGGVVRTEEWDAVCEVAGLKPDEQLVPTLINLGMVIREPTGWRFVHRLLGVSLERLSREAGRWSQLHSACAEALDQLYPDASEVAERRARHLLEAQRWLDALEPLRVAIEARFTTADLKDASELADAFGEALERADASERESVEHLLIRASLTRRTHGETDFTLLDEVLQRAEAGDWDHLIARAHHECGEAAAVSGRLDHAMEHYDAAWEAYERCGATPIEVASVLESRSWVFKTKGDTASAQRDLEAVLDTYRAQGEKMRELNTINALAFTFLAAGDYDASRQVARMGIDLGRELGHRGAEAGCWTTLGEIERFEGRLDEARECYRRAEELDTLCGNKHVLVVRANAALAEVAARDWDVALRRLDDVEPAMIAQGHAWMGPFFGLARACCCAGEGEWARFDELWSDATATIDELQLVERDVAWLAEIAADVCLSVEENVRARRALEYAVQQWDGLGDVAALAAARERLESVG